MEAHIDFMPATFRARLWLFQRMPEGTAIFDLDGSVRETVPTGAQPEPSVEIDEAVLKSIVAAASDQLPPTAATDRHLADAIAVRDRLMDAFLPVRSES